MAIEQTIITWIHLLSASIWVGGSIFLGAVLAPLLKKMSLSTGERLLLMIKTGRRFNKIALPSLIILIGTGSITLIWYFKVLKSYSQVIMGHS